MATTRKRKTAADAAPLQTLNVDSLAAFMGIEQPDRSRLTRALDLAIEAAEAVTGQPIGDTAPHGIRHGVHLLASELLIKDQLEDIPEPAAIPLVVRYLWQADHAGG